MKLTRPIAEYIKKHQKASFLLFKFVPTLSKGNLTANFVSANFANVASTRGRVCGVFRVDVVTRQTRRHSPSRVARTRQTCRHSPSRVARTRQTREM